MRTATITQAKNGLSALIDVVRTGESVLITDRGLVVARLVPVTGDTDAAGRWGRLERAGVLRVGDAARPIDLMGTPGPSVAPGASVVAALLADRRSSR